MKNIKNIIVAIDLSVVARNAYRYAKSLAKTLNATLTIVHVKEGLVIMVSDVVTNSFVNEDDTQLINEIKELVSEENGETKERPNEKAEIKIYRGDPVTILTDLSKKNGVDLIVIGTTGLADVLTKIFGSVSVKLSNKAHCPVILVPRDAKWKPIEQILYASDHDSLTSKFAQDIIDFAVKINSAIHFVNVRNYDPVGEIKQKDIDWDELLVATDSSLSYEKHTIYGNNTVAELKKYYEENNIDLITFSSKHRNFWENLMHKSISEKMVLSTNTPIMIIHSDDERP